MSTKRIIATALTMIVLATCFTVTPAEAKSSKDEKVLDGVVVSGQAVSIPTITGCVLGGVPVLGAESDQSVDCDEFVEVAPQEVPLVSASSIIADNKAVKSKSEKIAKDIKDKKKKAKKKYKKALRLLATIIYCEAGGQCYAGRLAVAAVVMNRVESAGYPNTIHGVLWQPYQFGPIRQGKMARELRYYDQGLYKYPERSGSLQAAKDILAGKYTVEYNGRKIDLKKYTNFNGHLSNAKIRISGHDFA